MYLSVCVDCVCENDIVLVILLMCLCLLSLVFIIVNFALYVLLLMCHVSSWLSNVFFLTI